VDRCGAQVLTFRSATLDFEMIADILTAALVTHGHLVSAFAAIGDAVEQGCSITRDSTALDVLVLCPIVAQHRLDLLEGLPIDLGRYFSLTTILQSVPRRGGFCGRSPVLWDGFCRVLPRTTAP